MTPDHMCMCMFTFRLETIGWRLDLMLASGQGHARWQDLHAQVPMLNVLLQAGAGFSNAVQTFTFLLALLSLLPSPELSMRPVVFTCLRSFMRSGVGFKERHRGPARSPG